MNVAHKTLSLLPFLARTSCVFFIISPFYWLPNIPYELMSFVRTFFLITLGSGIILVMIINKTKPLPGQNLIIYFYYMIGLIIYFIIFPQASLNILFFSIYVFLFFNLGYYFGIKKIEIFKANKVVIILALIYFSLSLNILLSLIFPYLNYLNPYYINLHNETGLLLDFPRLSDTGFNKSRTAWGLAAFFSSIFFILLAQNTSNFYKKIIFYITAWAGLLSLIVTGSRGALIYIFIFLLFWARKNIRTNFGLYSFLLITFFTLIFIYIMGGDYLRLRNVEDITTGRLDGYYYIMQIIENHVWWGTAPEGGYTLEDYGMRYTHVHNTWINMILTYGVILVTPAFIFVIWSIIRVLRTNSKHQLVAYPMIVVIFTGMISTLLEPESILSSSHFTLIWWCFLGFYFGSLKNSLQITKPYIFYSYRN